MNAMKLCFISPLLVAGVLAADERPAAEPLVLGYGEEVFALGRELYSTDFSDTNNWVIQVSTDDTTHDERVTFEDGVLDLYMPKRGCTAWLNRKFRGPITIVYNVRCPVETRDDEGILPTDINNFWHCSDPREFDAVLEETETRYNGDFVSYHEMQGYYASSGGGGHEGNQTTRFRRYPRWLDGKDIPHLSLNSQDGNPEHLITPGKWHTVQLVACDGLAQYIVDGNVVYEIKYGDRIMSESRPEGSPVQEEKIYTLEEYPAFTEGYFGLRMVRTHHRYRTLKIYQLEPKRKE